MADPALVISLAAEFVGKPAFKQADTATQKLSKNVGKLAKTFGVAFGVSAVLAFGKAAVKAAAADEKAQKQLALALQNVGLGRDVASSEAYLQKLSTEFGIVDDQLRPAYQTLAVATKSSSEAQKLLGIALDISASTGKDLGTVTGALSKAFLGNNTALGKLGVGISKADLKAGKFDDIMNQLAKTFKGAASASADTFSGKMAKLAVSIDNAKEILGKGLIDSFMILTDSANIDELQVKIEGFATSLAESFKNLAVFLKENEILLKSIFAILAATFVSTKIIAGIAATVTAIGVINKAYQALRATAIGTAIASMFALNPYGAAFQVAAMVALIGITIKAVDDLTESYNKADAAKNKLYDPDATGLIHLRELESRYNKAALTEEKKLTAEERKQLKDKKLQLAIDKAKLLLGKADDVFDMEKIQLAAAEKNAAEQLGKITSQAQLLQITNDLARLEVKQSINALEDAIAAKDIKAIEAGTAKLNADLMVLGALTGQKVKLTEISKILEAIVPKDLINLGNLDAAIARLMMIASFTSGGGMATHANPILGDPNKSPVGIPSVMSPSIYASGGRIDMGGNYNAFNPAMVGMTSGGSSGKSGTTVIVNAGTIATPDELVVLIKTAIQDLNRAGDSTTFAGAIA
jgi:hypothetical protein